MEVINMLTIKSNLNNFKNRQNEYYTVEDLSLLGKAIVTSDIINFKLKFVGGGFTDPIATKIITKLSGNTESTVLVINDLSLHVLNKLLEAGYKKSNIYLAYGKWDSDGTISTDTTVYNLMKAFIKANIKEKLNVVNLEELFMGVIKTDIIIANPPYGKIGANITKNIIDKVDYVEFINLLPLKDYTLEIGKYIDFTSITTFPPHSFSDADILTHAARVLDTAAEEVKTETDLCAAAFTVDKPMIKFMKANLKKDHYAIDNNKLWTKSNIVETSFIFHHMRAISQHTCGMDILDSDSTANYYNFKNEIKPEILKASGASAYRVIQFKTLEEKQNFVAFYKGNRNFINRMIANQFIGVRSYSACWPKVDWTKSDWTVETILKNVANYTDEEIKEVLDTMNKDYTVKDDASVERLFGEWL
jgi:hypothetical protein